MTVVCIAGMHRSGTSMIARVLNLCGLYLGEPTEILGAGPNNPEGHWENIHFLEINDGILAALKGGWDLPPALPPGWEDAPQVEEFAARAQEQISHLMSHDPCGWKDPRNSLTLPFWRKFVPGLKVIVCVRDPAEVAQSLAARGSSSVIFSMHLWQTYNEGPLDVVEAGSALVTHYDAFFYDAHAELRRLLGFLQMPVDEQVIDQACAAVNRGLKHNKGGLVAPGELRRFPDVAETYRRLCSHAGPTYQLAAKAASDSHRITRPKPAGPADTQGLPSATAARTDPIHDSIATPGAHKGPGGRATTPTVSVITLNYNGRDDIQVCLRSLEGLAFPRENLEVIVVDNGSTDGSVAMIESEFPRVRILQNSANLGFSVAANQGAAAAGGAHIALLNNDMRVDVNWLSNLMEAVEGGSGTACAGSIVMNWDGTEVQYFGRPNDLFGLGFAASAEHSGAGPLSRETVPAMFASGGAMLLRRSVFEEMGGFDPEYFMYHEDVDLGWRLWLSGHRVALCSDSVVYHKGGASSRRISYEYVNMIQQRNMLVTIYKNLEADSLAQLLPLLFYFLLERTRRWRPARESLQDAIQAVRASLSSVVAKRIKVQAARRLSDAELFKQVGHPFDFLLHDPAYAAVLGAFPLGPPSRSFDPENVPGALTAINEWLEEARIAFERGLLIASDRVVDLEAALQAIENSRSWQVARALQQIRRTLVPGARGSKP